MAPRLRSRTSLSLIATAAVLVVAAAIAFVYLRTPGSNPPADSALAGRLVAVNGHDLYLECQGTGAPAVILDAGLGDDSTVWDDVLLGTEDLGVRVCAYDRWGLGRSATGPAGPRPVTDATGDLHALLAAAGVSPPYVLVSHSIAGLIHRQFTALYPSEVRGLVMVDTAPDDWNVYLNVDEFTYGDESLDISAVAASLRQSDDLGQRPVVVLLGATSDQVATRVGFRDYWLAAQRALGALSTNSIVAIAADSDHGIPTTQPDLVSGAIGLVAAAANSGRPLPACPASGLVEAGGRCDTPAGPSTG